MTPTDILLHSHGFGKIPWEVHIKVLRNSKPISDELERDDVKDTLKHVDIRRHLNLLAFFMGELRVVLIADDNWPAATGDDYCLIRTNIHGRRRMETNLA